MPKREKNILVTGYMGYWEKFHQTSLIAQVQISRMSKKLGIVAQYHCSFSIMSNINRGATRKLLDQVAQNAQWKTIKALLQMELNK